MAWASEALGREWVGRLITALALAPLVVAAAWLGGWVFQALVLAAGAVLVMEGWRLLGRRARHGEVWVCWAALVPVVALAGSGREALAGVALAGAVLLAAGVSLARRRGAGAALLFTPVVLLLPLVLVWLRADPHWGRPAVLWLLATVWAADIAAYVTGRWIGGIRLAPRISPRKTWAGLGGGVGMAAGASMVVALALQQTPVLPFFLGAAAGVAAQLGDLGESWMKRRAGVKDAGRILPGHGGLLDRVDGLMAVAPAAALFGLIRDPASPAAGLLLWP